MQLRVYTVPFGRTLSDLYDELVSSARGWPPLPDPLPPAQASFKALVDDDPGLRFAGMEFVFDYLRRGRHLKVPAEWKDLIPHPTMPLHP